MEVRKLLPNVVGKVRLFSNCTFISHRPSFPFPLRTDLLTFSCLLIDLCAVVFTIVEVAKPVTGIRVLATGPRSLRVQWNKFTEISTTRKIEGYVITYFDNKHNMSERKVDGPNRTYTELTGLKIWTRYCIHVSTFNERGVGVASPKVCNKTFQDGKGTIIINAERYLTDRPIFFSSPIPHLIHCPPQNDRLPCNQPYNFIVPHPPKFWCKQKI